MSLFKKSSGAPKKPPKKEPGYSDWKVILKGFPDKQSEENFTRILTTQLSINLDEAAQMIRSIPLILFGDLTSHEAEQIKLALNETGARTALSNDPDELRGLAKVTWPKKITVEELGFTPSSGIPSPPPFIPPPSSPPPSFPVPPRRSEAPMPLPRPPEPRGSQETEREKTIQELEKLREELKRQLANLEKIILSLRGPVPPVPGLKGNPPLPPGVR